MMHITYLPHKDIDKMKWDACIDNASNGLIYAYSFYLDIMSKNWDALVMNNYEMVMPLTWNRKFGVSYLRQPAFTQQLGIFGPDAFSNEITEQFIYKALDVFPFMEINLNYANAHLKYSVKKCNLILPLHHPFTVIKESFRSDLVKKAISAHIVFEPSNNIEEAIKTFRDVYSNKVSHVSEKNYEDLLQVCILLKSNQQLLIRKVSSINGSLLSISIFFKDSKRIYYILSATLPNGRRCDANAFLLHELIREFSGQNLILDFEGSDIPSINFFFRKFNPLEQSYTSIAINKLPPWKKWIKRIYDLYK